MRDDPGYCYVDNGDAQHLLLEGYWYILTGAEAGDAEFPLDVPGSAE